MPVEVPWKQKESKNELLESLRDYIRARSLQGCGVLSIYNDWMRATGYRCYDGPWTGAMLDFIAAEKQQRKREGREDY